MKPYLTYYKKNKIIPVVKINNKNFNILNKQRNNLFDQLKIDKKLFYNSEILEVGPGTGYNAKYLIDNGIRKITLVDGNRYSIEFIKHTLKKKNPKKYQIINKDFYEFGKKKKFNFVVCENLISGVKKPNKFLKKLSSFVSDDGYLLINCSDSVSLFSEKIRGVLAYLLLISNDLNKSSFELKTKFLSKIFKTHLKSLGKNTRNIDDWVQDVLLHEYWWRKKNYFSLETAIKVVNKEFDFYSSSPDCFTNYAWYKNLNFNLNNHILGEYYKIQHNFFDMRSSIGYLSKENNKNLNNLVNKACNSIYNFNSNNLDVLISSLSNLKMFILKNKSYISSVNYLNQVISILKDYKKNKKLDLKKLEKIKTWWGYATQYIVFKKK